MKNEHAVTVEPWITAEQLRDLLGLKTLKAVYQLNFRQIGPKPHRIPGIGLRYNAREVAEWMKRQEAA